MPARTGSCGLQLWNFEIRPSYERVSMKPTGEREVRAYVLRLNVALVFEEHQASARAEDRPPVKLVTQMNGCLVTQNQNGSYSFRPPRAMGVGGKNFTNIQISPDLEAMVLEWIVTNRQDLLAQIGSTRPATARKSKSQSILDMDAESPLDAVEI